MNHQPASSTSSSALTPRKALRFRFLRRHVTAIQVLATVALIGTQAWFAITTLRTPGEHPTWMLMGIGTVLALVTTLSWWLRKCEACSRGRLAVDRTRDALYCAECGYVEGQQPSGAGENSDVNVFGESLVPTWPFIIGAIIPVLATFGAGTQLREVRTLSDAEPMTHFLFGASFFAMGVWMLIAAWFWHRLSPAFQSWFRTSNQGTPLILGIAFSAIGGYQVVMALARFSG